MASTDVTSDSASVPVAPARVDLKLEAVTLPVADVDRAKRFYEGLGWRLDADLGDGENFRVVQFTPPHSQCSIHFGKGLTSAAPGSADRLLLAVSDIEAAREELISRGVAVTAVEDTRPAGSTEGRSYFMYASFKDPDGNGWLLQEIKARLPGRVWNSTQARVAELARLLRETAEHHGHYENTHAEHHWWDWYAPYLSARQDGSDPQEAAAAADRYMVEVFRVLPQ